MQNTSHTNNATLFFLLHFWLLLIFWQMCNRFTVKESARAALRVYYCINVCSFALFIRMRVCAVWIFCYYLFFFFALPFRVWFRKFDLHINVFGWDAGWQLVVQQWMLWAWCSALEKWHPVPNDQTNVKCQPSEWSSKVSSELRSHPVPRTMIALWFVYDLFCEWCDKTQYVRNRRCLCRCLCRCCRRRHTELRIRTLRSRKNGNENITKNNNKAHSHIQHQHRAKPMYRAEKNCCHKNWLSIYNTLFKATNEPVSFAKNEKRNKH